MENYEKLIMELLIGETPKEKYENLQKIMQICESDFVLDELKRMSMYNMLLGEDE